MNRHCPGGYYKTAIFIGLLYFPFSMVNAEIYKWTDSNGKVYFSDKPTSNNQSQEIVPPKNTLSTIKIDKEKAEEIANVYSSSKLKPRPKPQRQFKQNSKSTNDANEKDINNRIKKCNDEHWSDCSRNEIVRQKGVEDYYKSPEGIRQSEINHNRRLREERELKRQYGIKY